MTAMPICDQHVLAGRLGYIGLAFTVIAAFVAAGAVHQISRSPAVTSWQQRESWAGRSYTMQQPAQCCCQWQVAEWVQRTWTRVVRLSLAWQL